jgi:prepilin-type processing-associated H-X9-DG protein
VSTGPQLVRPAAPRERNWAPLAIAAGIVVAVVAGLFLFFEHGKSGTETVTPISAQLDPYASNLAISNLAMSQSSNLAGGNVTYIDGHVLNNGNKTVTGITVQVLFRDPAHEVAQNETQAMKFIRTREPYVDIEPVSAAPLKPGDGQDFRLIFDTLTQDWDGAYPEIRIVHVDTN